jgi:ABC-type uncharacterized transport system permease subunit
MKKLVFLFLLFSVIACDPYGFGFKKNPAYVLDEAFKAVTNLDTQSFLDVTGKEVLCVYGNHQGINYLKDNVSLNQESIKLQPTVLETVHYNIPRFVGYWSYYHERYEIDILDKTTSETLLRTIVDCDYGTAEEKDEKFINLKPKRYKKKECRLVKLKPINFYPLPLSRRCEGLKVLL